MGQSRFVIESSEAQSLAQNSNRTVTELLPTLVESAKSLARPPISNYYVGAVGIGSSGRIFFGGNLEFPGLPLNQSVHAEQFLITNMALNNEPSLQYVAVSSAPCGHCRQFFQEIRNAPDIQLLITGDTDVSNDSHFGNPINGDIKKFENLSNLLPQRFGPYDLLDKSVPLLLEKHDNHLVLESANDDDMNEGMTPNGIYNNLEYAAFEAANRSHAPYSKCPSGVALMDDEGKIYKGSYTESAAYNPSLPPVQAAIVAYLVGGGGGYEKIVKAVLVEKEDAVVKHELTAKLILQAISPNCEFKILHCKNCV